MTALKGAVAAFDPTPSITRSGEVTIGVSKSVPTGAGVVGVPIGVDGAVPRELRLHRAALAALGFDGAVGQIAGVLGNHQGFVDQVSTAARNTDEPVWQLPLDKRYRKQLDSPIADMKNVGGDSPGAITAALFLAEFVGNVPWAHLDICGPMCADADQSWRSKGATGFGTRLLVDLALNFTRPAARA